MFSGVQGKLRSMLNKAILTSGNFDMKSLLALLQTIGIILACIAGFIAILVIVFLSGAYGQ